MSALSNGVFRNLGFVGPVLIVLAVLYSALRYRGRQDERFSLLNHFISELGELGVSPAAGIFNTGLALGGLALLPYVLWLGSVFHSLPGWLGTAAGAAAALSVSAVGVFPMNRLTPHSKAAMTYFRSGLLMVGFFGLAILLQPAEAVAVPKAANLLSLLAFASYAAFLRQLTRTSPEERPTDRLDPALTTERPRLWALPMLEWAVFFSTTLWLFGVALLLPE